LTGRDIIRKGVSLSGAGLADIAPTILHLMGQSVPDYMDGRVLEEAIEDEFMASHRPVRQRVDGVDGEGTRVGYSDDDKKEMEEKLKGLGYL
jgi:arylsulfatase A-like enzyme